MRKNELKSRFLSIMLKGVVMRRDYYLHKRNGIYYVEFVNKENGKKLTPRSTRETKISNAHKKAALWSIQGLPVIKSGRQSLDKKTIPVEEALTQDAIRKLLQNANIDSDFALEISSNFKHRGLIEMLPVANKGEGSVPFTEFLQTFWDYDKSEYIQDKLAHGHSFTRRRSYDCLNKIKIHLIPFFGDKKLNCVTSIDLGELSQKSARKGLATATINKTLTVCTTALKWAFNKKIIPENPSVGLTKFSIKNRERGILTEQEAAAVFSVEWGDKRAYVASLVAATTGARQGECLALRRSDIGTDTLNIAHSYSHIDGLKCPKNGHKRVVPLLPEVRAALLDLLQDNPHEADDPFVFFSSLPDRPVISNIILDGLKESLQKIEVDYKSRNICFHSWRHYFCSKITEIIDGEKVAKVSGHLSESVFKKYSSHVETKNIKAVGNAAALVFENILKDKGDRE
jgi:integrase